MQFVLTWYDWERPASRHHCTQANSRGVRIARLCCEGSVQFNSKGKTLELRSGDSVIVEGNVEHQATALEDSEVLDVFAPTAKTMQ